MSDPIFTTPTTSLRDTQDTVLKDAQTLPELEPSEFLNKLNLDAWLVINDHVSNISPPILAYLTRERLLCASKAFGPIFSHQRSSVIPLCDPSDFQYLHQCPTRNGTVSLKLSAIPPKLSEWHHSADHNVSPCSRLVDDLEPCTAKSLFQGIQCLWLTNKFTKTTELKTDKMSFDADRFRLFAPSTLHIDLGDLVTDHRPMSQRPTRDYTNYNLMHIEFYLNPTSRITRGLQSMSYMISEAGGHVTHYTSPQHTAKLLSLNQGELRNHLKTAKDYLTRTSATVGIHKLDLILHSNNDHAFTWVAHTLFDGIDPRNNPQNRVTLWWVDILTDKSANNRNKETTFVVMDQKSAPRDDSRVEGKATTAEEIVTLCNREFLHDLHMFMPDPRENDV